MVRLLWRTDVHLAEQTPASRLDDWAETVLGKLKQVGEIARKVGADAVIDGGDFFDRKSPSLTPHKLMVRIAEIHSAYPCPVYANIGNHDCVYGDREFLYQQPLGVLFSTGVFKRLYDAHEAIFESEHIKVRVVGVPYHGTKYDLSRLDIKKKDEDYLFVVAHLLASHKGGTMFESEDIVSYSDLLGLEADIFAFGHWHKNQGISEIEPGKWVVNVGSLTRGSLSQDNVDRKPVCVSLDFSRSGIRIEEHPIEIQPAAEVFKFEEKAVIESRKMLGEAYTKSVLAHLQNSELKESLEDQIKSMSDIDVRVRELALHFLDRV